MPKNLVTEISFIVLFPTLIPGKFTFLLYENSMYLVLSALMLILFDFGHLSRHFNSLFMSSAESITLSHGTQEQLDYCLKYWFQLEISVEI